MSVPVDTEFDRSRLAWWVIVFALAAVLAYVLYAFLGIFLLGLFVYYATRPIYRRVAARSPSPTLAVVGSLAAVALPILVLITYTVVVGVNELNQLVNAESLVFLDPYVDTSLLSANPQELFANYRGRLSDLTLESVRGALGAVVEYVGLIATALIYLFVVLAIAFFLLRDGDCLAGWYKGIVGADSAAYAYAAAVDRDLQTLYFGNILTAFAIAIVAAISYNALDAVAPGGLGVPSPTLLGLLTGVGSLIPVIGIKLVYVPIAVYVGAVAALQSPGQLWFPAAFVLVAFVIVDTLPELLLRPYISGRSLNVGLVMFAYILGPVLFGWYGLFLAPLLLVLIVQAARLILPDLVRGGDVRPDTPALLHSTGDDPVPDVVAGDVDADADAGTGTAADAETDADADAGTAADESDPAGGS